LLALGPRDNQYNSNSNAFFHATEYVKVTIRKMGMVTVRQRFSYGNNRGDYRPSRSFRLAAAYTRKEKSCKPTNNASCNLCGLIPGKTKNVIVVGAHLDTVENSPGANDNGSSVVALIEIIRILKQANLQLNNPILFCFWGSKEIPLNAYTGSIGFGSEFFLYNHSKNYQFIINKLAQKNDCQKQINDFNIQCYLNLELSGTKRRKFISDISIDDPRYTKYLDINDIPPTGTKNLTELYANFLRQQKINFFRAAPKPNSTDVSSFYDKNIPGFTITAGPSGTDKDPSCYHKPCDDITEIDFEVLSNITQTVLYSLTHLSLKDDLSNI
jgi:aminopeptidase S